MLENLKQLIIVNLKQQLQQELQIFLLSIEIILSVYLVLLY